MCMYFLNIQQNDIDSGTSSKIGEYVRTYVRTHAVAQGHGVGCRRISVCDRVARGGDEDRLLGSRVKGQGPGPRQSRGAAGVRDGAWA